MTRTDEDRPSPDRAWTPLLAGSLRARAMDAIGAIAAHLRMQMGSDLDPFVATGSAGLALFFAYLSDQTGDDKDADAAARLLDRAIQAGPGASAIASLHQGQTGVGWTVAHLGAAIDMEGNEPLGGLDRSLSQLLSASPWESEYDLISGLVGFGVYALERMPRESATLLLDRIVGILAEIGERTGDRITWRTAPESDRQRTQAPEGWYDLGVAHGVPGIIAFLAGAVRTGVGGSTARELLGGAVTWVLDQRLPEPTPSVFPARVGPGLQPRPTRSAWCYGDPGVAATLLRAAAATRERAWADDALAIALKGAGRPEADTGVTSAMVCHGAAGLAHVYGRIYQATGDPRLARAARAWYRRTVELLPDLEEIEFLEGKAGVGLVLLAATSEVEPAWDRILLLS